MKVDRRDLIACAGYVVLSCAAFRTFLFRSGELLGGAKFDSHLFFYPRFWLWWQHGLVGWSPYHFFGTPFLADPQDCCYYPLLWPFTFLTPGAAINWSVSFHAVLAGCFTYLFVRLLNTGRLAAFAGGLVFGLGSLYCCKIRAGYVTVLYTLGLMPLIFFLLRRLLSQPSVLCASLLGTSIGVQVLAGHAQFAALTIGAGAIYAVVWIACACRERPRPKSWRLAVLYLAFVLLVAGASAAVKIVPTTELMLRSNRPNLSLEQAARWHAEPQDALTFLVPNFFGDHVRSPYWGRGFITNKCVYLGLLPLLLCGIALARRRDRETLALSVIGCVGLVLALGPLTPAYRLGYYCVPGLALFREPTRFLTLTGFAGAVLAGLGLDELTRSRSRIGRATRVAAIIAFLAAVIALIVVIAHWQTPMFVRRAWAALVARWGDPQVAASSGLTEAELLQDSWSAALQGTVRMGLLAAAAGLLLWLRRRVREPKAILLASIALIWLDLFLYVDRFVVAARIAPAVDQDAVKLMQERRETERFRVHYSPYTVANFLPQYGLESVDGYNPVQLHRFSRLTEFDPEKDGLPSAAQSWQEHVRLIGAANVRYLVRALDDPLPAMPFLERGAPTSASLIYESQRYAPRTFLTTRWEVVRDPQNQLKRLMAEDFDPRDSVLLEAPPEGVSPSVEEAGSATIRVYECDRVEIEVQAERPSILVLADAWYPGWAASCRQDGGSDGVDLPVLRANYMFRAVVVPEGRSAVTFRFRSMTLRLGRAISVVTAIALLSYWSAAYWRGRARRTRRT